MKSKGESAPEVYKLELLVKLNVKQLHITSDNKESKAPGAAGRTVFENDEKKPTQFVWR